MLTFTSTSDAGTMAYVPRPMGERSPFVFVGERLWLDFVNSEFGIRRFDALRDFDSMVRWLEAAAVLDAERASGITAAAPSSRQARPRRSSTRGACERVARARRARTLERSRALDGLGEINRVLGRSAGTRRVNSGPTGRSFAPSCPWATRSPVSSSRSSNPPPTRSSSAS